MLPSASWGVVSSTSSRVGTYVPLSSWWRAWSRSTILPPPKDAADAVFYSVNVAPPTKTTKPVDRIFAPGPKSPGPMRLGHLNLALRLTTDSPVNLPNPTEASRMALLKLDANRDLHHTRLLLIWNKRLRNRWSSPLRLTMAWRLRRRSCLSLRLLTQSLNLVETQFPQRGPGP